MLTLCMQGYSKIYFVSVEIFLKGKDERKKRKGLPILEGEEFKKEKKYEGLMPRIGLSSLREEASSYDDKTQKEEGEKREFQNSVGLPSFMEGVSSYDDITQKSGYDEMIQKEERNETEFQNSFGLPSFFMEEASSYDDKTQKEERKKRVFQNSIGLSSSMEGESSYDDMIKKAEERRKGEVRSGCLMSKNEEKMEGVVLQEISMSNYFGGVCCYEDQTCFCMSSFNLDNHINQILMDML